MLRALRLNPYKPKRSLQPIQTHDILDLVVGDELDRLIRGETARREAYNTLRSGQMVVLPNGDRLYPLGDGQKFMLYSWFEE